MSRSLGRLVFHRPSPFHGVLALMVMGSAAAALFLNPHLDDHHQHAGRPRKNNEEQQRLAKNWPTTAILTRRHNNFKMTMMMRTSCEGFVEDAATAAAAAAVLENDDAKDDDATTTTTTTTTTISWEKMNVPDRATVSSHAIIGTLLNDDRIERYDVYRRVESSTTTTLATTSLDEKEQEEDDDNDKEEEDRRSNHHTAVRAMVRLGEKLNGHPGIVHGGILALLIDDILGFGFVAANVSMAVTANLNIDYRAPVPAGTTIVIDAVLDEQRRNDAPRKLYWNVTVTDAVNPSLVYCNATSLFIIPRQHHHQQM